MRNIKLRGTLLFLVMAALLSLLSCAADIPVPDNPWIDGSGGEQAPGYRIGMARPDEMPVLRIDTDSGAEIASRDAYIDAAVGLDEPLGLYSFADLRAEVRCRGNYTYYGPGVERKSFRLRFEEKEDPLGLGQGGSRNWVLLANWCDRSMLRNYVAFAMAKKLNVGFSSDAAFVEVYVNGDYRGVYLLCEHPSRNGRRIDIDEQPDVLDSDYLIELDMRADETGAEGIDYFVSDGKLYVVKNDEIHPGALDFLADFFDGMNDAIAGGDRERIERYIDVESFVDMYILQEYTMNYDVGWASLYFVKEASGKLKLTFPWDFDLAFGNYSALGNAKWDVLYAGGDKYAHKPNSSPMFRGLMDCDWFAELVEARWGEIGAVLRDVALYEIAAIRAVYTDEILRNYEKYPTLGTDFVPLPRAIARLTDYDDVADQLVEWVYKRWKWLDGEIG